MFGLWPHSNPWEGKVETNQFGYGSPPDTVVRRTHPRKHLRWRLEGSPLPRKYYWGMNDLITDMIEGSTNIDYYLSKIEGHPSEEDCPNADCMICGVRACPYDEPTHFHKEGCVACYWNVFTPEQQAKRDEKAKAGQS